MFEVFTFGPLRVTLDPFTGEVVAVRDALTGCAASLLYSKRDIALSVRLAQMALASITEPV